jgi:molecular chaperone GrpE (heat shock protein)
MNIPIEELKQNAMMEEAIASAELATTADEWREEVSELMADMWELLPDVKYKQVTKAGVIKYAEKEVISIITNALDQHSAQIIETLDGLKKVLSKIRTLEDGKMKNAADNNELYDASVWQWATVGLKIISDIHEEKVGCGQSHCGRM